VSSVLFNYPKKSANTLIERHEVSIKRAIGLIHLPLSRDQRQLHLSIDVPEKNKPLTLLAVKLQLDNKAQIIDKKLMVTLAAVDVGVLNVSNFATPDPFSWFFSQRRYAVDSLDLYNNIMNGQTGIMGQQRFGGDMDLQSAGNLQKANNKIVSLFHQPVTFDAQGQAQVNLSIPDFNGQLRLMAVAFGDTSYGHAQKDITIAAPIVTQLSMPLFLAANDHAQITLDVHNLSDQEQAIDIELLGDKLLDISHFFRAIRLKKDEKKVLHYTLKTKDNFGVATIKLHLSQSDKESNEQEFITHLNATKETINLQRQWQLSIRPAWPAIERNQQLILSNKQPSILALNVADMMPETRMGKLTLSNQLPIDLATHLEQLLKYPYGCLEQSISSSFPWLYTKPENMKQLGLNELKVNKKIIDFTQRKTYLKRGVQRLSAKQLSNGGFGLWSNHSSEEFWLSVYATQFLLQAKDQNIDVPSVVLKPAISRLQQYLRSSRPGYDYRYSDYPGHILLAYKAYAAYVLSSIKQASLGSLRTLFDYHKKDARSGLPLMHLGIALLRQGDLKRGKEAIANALRVKRDAHHYLGDYGSVLRDLSLMIEALVRYQPNHSGINTLLYELQAELSRRKWLSTQERNALFMAGVALKEQPEQSKQVQQHRWQALIKTAMGSQKIIHQGDFQHQLNQDEMNAEIELSTLTDERLYASLNINGYTKNPPDVNFKYFNITRHYYNAQGKMITPKNIAVGELLIVELSLLSNDRIQDALVVDLLPAGFEIENQNLTHSLKLSEYKIEQKVIIDKISTQSIKYQAWRDDRYIAAIDIQAGQTQHLYYLLRAVTPGTYQVPAPYAEDMYRPYIHAIGLTPEKQTILNRLDTD
jgi:uncharacterized protein YfaS (alpha-2-macroglobulin family)